MKITITIETDDKGGVAVATTETTEGKANTERVVGFTP